MKFTAPVAGDSKKLDTEKIPTGHQLCRLYGIVDLGTQEGGNFGPKHKVGMQFEFPQELRVFYEGDEAKPSAIYEEQTLSLHKKSNLRKSYIEPMLGKTMTDEEAKVFDIGSLLGNFYIATITHSSDGKYHNITSISELTTRSLGMFGYQSIDQIPKYNTDYFFHLTQGFDSDSFMNLPKFLRKKLRESAEGEAFSAAGGKFKEPDPNSFGNNTPSAPGSQAPQGAKKLVMNADAQYTYEALKGGGWTDQQIVEGGYATWQQPTPPPTPQAAPPAPQAAPPAPMAPPVAPAPAAAPPVPASKPVLVFTPEYAGQPLEAWITAGWTEEMIVAKGMASWSK